LTHEFKNIINSFLEARKIGLKSVLVTVVDLDGSSYRKPGVRMLVLGNDAMIGAVSGGCVEKEILRQAKSVFENGKAKIFTYDGRFRLGCEGVIYILLEPFNPEVAFISVFQNCLKSRNQFTIHSKYKKEEGDFDAIGSYVDFGNIVYSISEYIDKEALLKSSNLLFSQNMEPCFKLMIFGTEHDAVQLCQFASLTGWEVTIVGKPTEHKSIDNFSGATNYVLEEPGNLDLTVIDNQTAIMIMTHSFSADLKCLLVLKDLNPIYIGLLGPVHKRENLLSQLMDYYPDINESFLEVIHGPAGLNIGSETPQEIAVSIISEILSVFRKQTPMSLKDKTGRIHA